ncbi:unnamed protein product [Alternaria alternata]
MASSPIRQAFEKILTDKKNRGLPPLEAEDYDHFLAAVSSLLANPAFIDEHSWQTQTLEHSISRPAFNAVIKEDCETKLDVRLEVGEELDSSGKLATPLLCKGDIIYLLGVGREQISAYPWALEVSDTPLPAEADLLASVASLKESGSSRKEDAERQTQQDPNKPYPKGFDASKKESVDRIAIKIQPQLWEKNNGEIKILGYDAWFQVDNLLLQKYENLDPQDYDDWDPAT